MPYFNTLHIHLALSNIILTCLLNSHFIIHFMFSDAHNILIDQSKATNSYFSDLALLYETNQSTIISLIYLCNGAIQRGFFPLLLRIQVI